MSNKILTPKELITKEIEKNGLHLAKETGNTLFSTTYNKIIVYSEEELSNAIKQGFSPDEDMGTFVFNALRHKY